MSPIPHQTTLRHADFMRSGGICDGHTPAHKGTLSGTPVDCLACKGEGTETTCRDPYCVERGECIHPERIDDCPSCDGRGWVT